MGLAVWFNGHMAIDLDSVVADLRETREQLARDLARVDAAIAALVGEPDDGSTNSPITDRIIEMFENYPGRRFTAESALDQLKEDGWKSPAADPVNAMRTALSRLSRKGVIERVGRGEYRRPSEENSWKRPQDPWANPVDPDEPPWAAVNPVKEAPF